MTGMSWPLEAKVRKSARVTVTPIRSGGAPPATEAVTFCGYSPAGVFSTVTVAYGNFLANSTPTFSYGSVRNESQCQTRSVTLSRAFVAGAAAAGALVGAGAWAGAAVVGAGAPAWAGAGVAVGDAGAAQAVR